MMAIVTCQVGADHVYWAYIPNPPLFQAVSWGDPEVLVYINETQWMPGLFDPLLTAHPNEEGKPAEGNNNSCSFPLGAEGIPLCIGKGSHCLQTSHEAWGLRYNHSYLTMSTFLLSVKSFKVGNSTTEKHPPTLVSLCPIPEINAEICHFTWIRCRGHNPKILISSTEANNQSFSIIDWSHGDFTTKCFQIPLKWHKENHAISGQANETIIWHEAGLTPPLPHLNGSVMVQGHIWKLLAALEPSKTWRGNSLFSSVSPAVD